MARFSKDTNSDFRSTLSKWHSPEDMKNCAEGLMGSLGSVDLFNQPGVEFVREAWAAGMFGIARKVSAVRLVNDVWPDFELDTKHGIEPFEFTEADLPERRRGKEYVESAESGCVIEEYPVEEWIKAAEEAPKAIRTAANKKASKHYPKNSHLLIYLNIEEFGIRKAEIEASFKTSTEIAEDAFLSVWILWKGMAYNPWPKTRQEE